jgi:hypothetical protein
MLEPAKHRQASDLPLADELELHSPRRSVDSPTTGSRSAVQASCALPSSLPLQAPPLHPQDTDPGQEAGGASDRSHR